MKKYIIFFILLSFSISFIAEPRKIVSKHFIIYCPDNYPGEKLADYFEKAYHYYNTYFGFNLTGIKVYVKDIGKYLGLAGTRTISINRMTYSPAVCAHELFHLVQSFYGIDVFDEDWVVEGTAVASEEIVYPSSNRYLKYAKQYLNNPNKDLFNRSYDACLFWIYVWRNLGVDVVRNVLKSYSEVENFTGVVNGFGGIDRFNKIFLDFAEANYFKRYDDAEYFVDVPIYRIFVSNSSYSFSVERYGLIYVLLNSTTLYKVDVDGNIFGRIIDDESIDFKNRFSRIFSRNILLILSSQNGSKIEIRFETYRGIDVKANKTIISNKTFNTGRLYIRNIFNISYPLKIVFKNLYGRNDTIIGNIILKPLEEKVLEYNILVENKTISIEIYHRNLLIKKLKQNITKISEKSCRMRTEIEIMEKVNKSINNNVSSTYNRFQINVSIIFILMIIFIIMIAYYYDRYENRGIF